MAEKCHAHSRSGAQCKRWAAPGQKVCHNHGAASPQARRAAERRLAEQKARALLGELTDAKPLVDVDDVYDALLDIASQAKQFADLMRDQVARLQSIRYESSQQFEQVRGEIQVYMAAMRQAESTLAKIAHLDLEGRRVRLLEKQVRVTVECVSAVLNHPRFSLSSEAKRFAMDDLAQRLSSGDHAPKAITTNGSNHA